MEWYTINKDYMNYLKKFDRYVPYVEYKNRMKCFLGILLTIENMSYFAPLTSFKPKFIGMKDNLDFYKIINTNTGKIYGAIDLNNMIPVTENNYIKVTYDNLDEFRTFKNLRDKKSYWKLLCQEASFIDRKVIIDSVEQIYKLKIQYPNKKISKRCCNFKLLEEKAKAYLEKQVNYV